MPALKKCLPPSKFHPPPLPPYHKKGLCTSNLQLVFVALSPSLQLTAAAGARVWAQCTLKWAAGRPF